MRQFVLIFGIKNSLTDDLVEELKSKNYKCIFSHSADEVEQVGRQFGKVAILFFDHKLAVNFLKESNLSTFHKFRAVFFDRKPILNPKVQFIFDEVFLKIYYPQIYEDFFKDLAEFFASEELDKPIEDIDAIEFTNSNFQNPFTRKK